VAFWNGMASPTLNLGRTRIWETPLDRVQRLERLAKCVLHPGDDAPRI
jgi:hypothetical protein